MDKKTTLAPTSTKVREKGATLTETTAMDTRTTVAAGIENSTDEDNDSDRSCIGCRRNNHNDKNDCNISLDNITATKTHHHTIITMDVSDTVSTGKMDEKTITSSEVQAPRHALM